MKVCMPVKADQGLESLVYGHFGSAPFYVVFDSESNQVQSVVNTHKQHEHGGCDPLEPFSEHKPDVVVVGGIGKGALGQLHKAGVKVFKAEGKTVQENINVFSTKGLPEFDQNHTCQGHHHHHEKHHHEDHEHQHRGGCGCSGGDDKGGCHH